MKKLSRKFYERDTLTVARELLGKVLVYKQEDRFLKGRIVETEAYIGAIDKAAHCYNQRVTKRTEVMFGPPGHAYVYLIYGMYYCMNVVTEPEGVGAAVLIRALEPLEGMELMSRNRFGKGYEELPQKKRIQLSNGPGKLCMAFGITKANNGNDLLSDHFFICEDEHFHDFGIGRSKRINVDYAEEAKDFEWRFFIKGNAYVSR